MSKSKKKRRPAGPKNQQAATAKKKQTAKAAQPAAVKRAASAPAKPKAAPPAEPVKPAVSAETTTPETPDTAALKAKTHKRHMRALRSLLIRVLLLALVVYILFFHLVGIIIMPNGDMYPRIDAGDLVLYFRLENTIRAQDVIVFKKPTASLDVTYHQQQAGETAARPEKTPIRKALDWLGFADPADPPMTTFVCRVVAGPGDTVEVTDNERLLVNGNAVVETNIFYSTPKYEGFVEYPLTLGEGQYFVLADSRNGGADSRFFGVVNRDEIIGTVITIMRRNNL